MARYSGPKARINRRLGVMVYESRGAVRAMERREQPPGMHTRPRRPSNYGAALREKQKIKHYYGLLEKQLQRYFTKASHMKGNTGEQLLLMCERRLDNVVRRAGYTITRPQARQGIAHGHFRVNGVKVTKPSFQVRPGDVISLRERESIQNLYRGITSENMLPSRRNGSRFDGVDPQHNGCRPTRSRRHQPTGRREHGGRILVAVADK